MKRIFFVAGITIACSALAGQQSATTSDRAAALSRISANSMRGHLSFLASDTLEGRGTPSKGLDLAAEYIAAQFRRAGLEPVGDDGYFQTAPWPLKGEPTGKVRNVIGILRGSDPLLKDTYVLVTAHYDHVGVNAKLDGDQIFNGANDDGSGTVSVIELASALATLEKRPKRTLVFMTFFGEERGLLGSRYYGKNPIFPIEKTIAHVNLEHMGRTDDSEGPHPNAAWMTGYDFSDVGAIFTRAGKETGIDVSKHARNSDSFFSRSDNQALADLGVPAHTICTAFIFPDYHKVGDHWDKIDYENMAKVGRMVGAGLLSLASAETEPKWNAENPKAAKYLKAWNDRRAAIAPN